MTTASSIEERLAAVEEAIAELRRKDDRPIEHPDWLVRLRGSLRGEPAFAEVIAPREGVSHVRSARGGRRELKYLLDADHISIYQWEEGAAFERLEAKLATIPRSEVAISIVSVHEQFLGCHALINKARSARGVIGGYRLLSKVRDGFAWAIALPFDDIAAQTFADLQAQQVKIGTMNLRIASITLSRNLTVLTRNRGDFAKVPGLAIEDWTK